MGETYDLGDSILRRKHDAEESVEQDAYILEFLGRVEVGLLQADSPTEEEE